MGYKSDFVRALRAPFAADGVIHRAVVDLTNAQIKALRASPKQLVAAPGADLFIQLIDVTLILNYGSEALTESTDNMVVQYDGGEAATAAIEATGFIDATADTICHTKGAGIAAGAASGIVNKKLELKNSGDGEYAGNASLDTTMRAIVTYWVQKANL